MKEQSFLQLLQKNKGFILQVYTCLIIELCITFFIVYYFKNNEALSKITKQSFILYLAICIALIIILTFDIPTWLKLLLFTVYAVVLGALLHQVSYKIDSKIITRALLCTISIFIVMTIIGFILLSFNIELSFIGLYILAGIIGLIISTLILYFSNNIRDEQSKSITNIYRSLLVIGVIIFSVYIMWSTSNLMIEGYNKNFVDGAIDLYLGFINNFIRILILSNE